MKFDDLLQLPHIWDVLRAETRPILIYGTGNGADKILDVMAARGICAAGVFASDGFVRSRDFRGMHVTSYSQAIADFGEDVVILAAFGSPRDEVLSFIDTLSARHTLYIPDVPLFANDLEAELFTPAYAIAHREQIERAAEAFDPGSVELFMELLAYRITGGAGYLRRTQAFELSVRECLPADTARVIDAGAFNGDTARTFLAAFPALERIVCAEPDARTFRRLSEFAATDRRIIALNTSVGDTPGSDSFSAAASRASAVERQSRRSRTTEVPRVTVDLLTGYDDTESYTGIDTGSDMGSHTQNNMGNDTESYTWRDTGSYTRNDTGGDTDICEGAANKHLATPDAAWLAGTRGTAGGDGRLLIKLDVEGAERASLEGARRTIAAERPALAVSLYHRTADIFEIPLFLRSIHADYRLSLRRARCIPGWEITLFAE